MQRINTSTADANLFGGGKNGFKNGNLAEGIVATQFEAEWCNQVQEEIAGIIEGFGVALDVADKHQMYSALATFMASKAGMQAQTYTAFTTGGTSTAFTLTPAPALTALAAGQRFRVEFHTTAGATPTLAISGLAAKSLKKYDYAGAKVACSASDIIANMLTDVEYDGVDYVLLNRLHEDFAASLVSAGYQKLPNGLILQWGTNTFGPYTAPSTIALPIAFPTEGLRVIASGQNSNGIGANAYTLTTTQFLGAAHSSSGSYSSQWFAIGF